MRHKPLLKLKNEIISIIVDIWDVLSFIILLSVYLIIETLTLTDRLLIKIFKKRKAKRSKLTLLWLPIYRKSTNILERHREDFVYRTDLIELAIRNMKVKKTRTIITVGGMAIGIGAIVFLVSIGYGLQELVISRITRLEEMQQTTVYSQTNSNLKINDKALIDFKQLPVVIDALPVITAVGKINYNGSISDVVVYGVTSDYLKQSAIKPIYGNIFNNNKYVLTINESEHNQNNDNPDVIQNGQKIKDINFSIEPNNWVRVRNGPSIKNSKIIGYTKRIGNNTKGELVWGETYSKNKKNIRKINDKDFEPWIKTSILLWEQTRCDDNEGDCEEGKYKVQRDEKGSQLKEEGYIAQIGTVITDINGNNGTTDSDIEWAELEAEIQEDNKQVTKLVEISTSTAKEAVVNQSMLSLLGIDKKEAVGKTFSTTFVIVGELLEKQNNKIESLPIEYKIVGVIPKGNSPMFYVPFIDLRSLGISNYSQAKVIVEDEKKYLAQARQQIEAMGYTTQSVADTVSQINTLFATTRTLFALLGMVALAISALGMFNTLTISLLERTREIGLMKAMGMRSEEIKDLFLTESMVMGFYGGILGIILGWILGHFLSLILTIFAVSKGAGIINISNIPFYFALFIAVLSLIVGIITGLYPAKRATKISALNALRYE